MNEDEVKGKARDIKGHVKEAAGSLVGNERLEREGEVDQATGEAQQSIGKAKRKLGDAIVAPRSVPTSAQGDILQALLALGYNERDAAATLRTLPEGVEVAAGIKQALRALAK